MASSFEIPQMIPTTETPQVDEPESFLTKDLDGDSGEQALQKSKELYEHEKRVYELAESWEAELIARINREIPDIKYLVGFNQATIRETIWLVHAEFHTIFENELELQTRVTDFILRAAKFSSTEKRFSNKGILAVTDRELLKSHVEDQIGNRAVPGTKLRLFRAMTVHTKAPLVVDKSNHSEIFGSIFPEKEYGNYVYEYDIDASSIKTVMTSGYNNIYFGTTKPIENYQVYQFYKPEIE